MNTNHINIKPGVIRTAFIGITCALAITFGFLENLMPPLPFLPPGAKLGLSNIVVMFSGWTMGLPYAIITALVKGLFSGITRGFTAAFMSLSGGLLSAVITTIFLRIKNTPFGMIGIGIIGGITHNIGQLTAACIITTGAVWGYLPVLLIFGGISGALTGTTLYFISKAIMNSKLKQYFS